VSSGADAARIAKRIVDELAEQRPEDEDDDGVQDLNHGFFLLERMRTANAAKKKGEVRQKVRGK
jgi:hypothetical protein